MIATVHVALFSVYKDHDYRRLLFGYGSLLRVAFLATYIPLAGTLLNDDPTYS
jgi:hypothetical protein